MIQSNLTSFPIKILTICHILLFTASNLLVQYPFYLFGFHTTWGAFTYPAIFILTDLTVRLSTAADARKIIFCSMIPGLLISYAVASYVEISSGLEWCNLLSIHIMPCRIAIASFIAYAVGQLLDIFVFQRYRNQSSWLLAPSISTSIGNLVDTVLFFAIAFYHSPNIFLSQHWVEIASVDIFFKITISLVAFIPIYGFVLNLVNLQFTRKSIA